MVRLILQIIVKMLRLVLAQIPEGILLSIDTLHSE